MYVHIFLPTWSGWQSQNISRSKFTPLCIPTLSFIHVSVRIFWDLGKLTKQKYYPIKVYSFKLSLLLVHVCVCMPIFWESGYAFPSSLIYPSISLKHSHILLSLHIPIYETTYVVLQVDPHQDPPMRLLPLFWVSSLREGGWGLAWDPHVDPQLRILMWTLSCGPSCEGPDPQMDPQHPALKKFYHTTLLIDSLYYKQEKNNERNLQRNAGVRAEKHRTSTTRSKHKQ